MTRSTSSIGLIYTVLINGVLSCYEGQYYTGYNYLCRDCPSGTFMADVNSALSCHTCPFGQTGFGGYSDGTKSTGCTLTTGSIFAIVVSIIAALCIVGYVYMKKNRANAFQQQKIFPNGGAAINMTYAGSPQFQNPVVPVLAQGLNTANPQVAFAVTHHGFSDVIPSGVPAPQMYSAPAPRMYSSPATQMGSPQMSSAPSIPKTPQTEFAVQNQGDSTVYFAQ